MIFRRHCEVPIDSSPKLKHPNYKENTSGDFRWFMPVPTLVVPCYNEAQRLPIAEFSSSIECQHGPRFLFVNDGSQDNTEAVLQDLARRNPHKGTVLSLGENRGKAEAVRQGMLAAFSRGDTHVGFWDADLATPLSELSRFESILLENPGLSLVLGSRVPLLGNSIRKDPFRHGLGRVVAAAIGWTLGIQVHDTQCGAKLFRDTAAIRAVFSVPFISRWLFDVEILARLISLNRSKMAGELESIALELPLTRWDHVEGSKVKPTDFFRAFRDLRRIWLANLAPGTSFVPKAQQSAAAVRPKAA